jgi:hypothetical protein
LSQGNYLNGVTYSSGTFIAVGALGTILTSPDGITWTFNPIFTFSSHLPSMLNLLGSLATAFQINHKGGKQLKKFVGIFQIFVLTIVAVFAFAAYSEAMMLGGGGGTMGSGMMQMPTGQQMVTYGATSAPITGSDFTTMMPIGVGSVAMGGNTLSVQVATSEFVSPVDMYFAIYAPSIDPFNFYMLHPDGSLQPASSGMEPWMSGVTSVNQTIFGSIPTSALPKGTYTMGFMATPAGTNMSTYYFWMTNFTIQ